MKQVIFNSFPRSGNVYSSHAFRAFFDSMFASVHIPEIFQVKEIANVTIFRKPSDAISSLQYKQLETSRDGMINFDTIGDHIKGSCDLYLYYMDYASRYSDNIYIGKFEDLISNTVVHFENVSKKFDIPLLSNYKENYDNLNFSGNLWENQHDGHVPRAKNEIRLGIEKAVAKLPIIKELDEKYEIFIEKYQTRTI